MFVTLEHQRPGANMDLFHCRLDPEEALRELIPGSVNCNSEVFRRSAGRPRTLNPYDDRCQYGTTYWE